jgi:hypothetical protein
VPALADVQRTLRVAVTGGDAADAAAILVGGRDPLKRLAIHARHYEASLAGALVGKFPALVWLAGSDFVSEAARAYVRRFPPKAPCIAEYGEDFPEFLAARPGAQRLPYLKWTGALEWRLAQAALAIEHDPITIEALRGHDGDELADVALRVQPGLHYFAAPYPVDELVQLFLTEAEPETFAMNDVDIRLEVRGARASFTIQRLDEPTFRFRTAIARGETIGTAAEAALEADAAFDPGAALVRLVAEGLAIEAVAPGRRIRT